MSDNEQFDCQFAIHDGLAQTSEGIVAIAAKGNEICGIIIRLVRILTIPIFMVDGEAMSPTAKLTSKLIAFKNRLTMRAKASYRVASPPCLATLITRCTRLAMICARSRRTFAAVRTKTSSLSAINVVARFLSKISFMFYLVTALTRFAWGTWGILTASLAKPIGLAFRANLALLSRVLVARCICAEKARVAFSDIYFMGPCFALRTFKVAWHWWNLSAVRTKPLFNKLFPMFRTSRHGLPPVTVYTRMHEVSSGV